MSTLDVQNFLRGHLRGIQGSRAVFKAICPFHNDTQPSLSIDLRQNLFHCFGCGVGGHINKLLKMLGSDIQQQNTIIKREKKSPPVDFIKDLLYYSEEPDLNYWKTRNITFKSLAKMGVRKIKLDRICSLYKRHGEGLKKRFPGNDYTYIFPIIFNDKLEGGIYYFANADSHYWTIFNSNLSTTVLDYSNNKQYAFLVEGEVDCLSMIEFDEPVIGIYSNNLSLEKAEILPSFSRLVIMLDNIKSDTANRGGQQRQIKTNGEITYIYVNSAFRKCIRNLQWIRPEIELFYYDYPHYTIKDPNDLLRNGYQIDYKRIRKLSNKLK